MTSTDTCPIYNVAFRNKCCFEWTLAGSFTSKRSSEKQEHKIHISRISVDITRSFIRGLGAKMASMSCGVYREQLGIKVASIWHSSSRSLFFTMNFTSELVLEVDAKVTEIYKESERQVSRCHEEFYKRNWTLRYRSTARETRHQGSLDITRRLKGEGHSRNGLLFGIASEGMALG